METICSDCGCAFDTIETTLNIYHGKIIFNSEQKSPEEQLCPKCRLRLQVVNSKESQKLRRRLVVFAVAAILTLSAIAVPNLLASHRAANEAATISALRTIVSAQYVYKAMVGNGDYATLEELFSSGLIDPSLASGKRNGYIFIVAKLSHVSDNTPPAFNVTAVPESISGWNPTGSRSFYTNEDGVIYYNYTGIAPIRTPSGSDGIAVE